MKNFVSLLMALIMIFAFSTSAMADGSVDMGEVDDGNYDKYIYEAPNASPYQMSYSATDPAMTKIGQRMVRTVGAISGIDIEFIGISADHDVQFDIYPIIGGDPIVSGTFHVSNAEPYTHHVNFVSNAENVYNVRVTHPEGTDGIITIYFTAPPSINNIENVTE